MQAQNIRQKWAINHEKIVMYSRDFVPMIFREMVYKSMGYYDTKARSIIVRMRAVLAHNLRLELAFE